MGEIAMKKTMSIIVPCYNEQESIVLFYNEILNVEKSIKNVIFEIVFIDDGSTDKTLQILRTLAQSDPKVKCVSFSRNFGKEAAIFAGLNYCVGVCAVVIDCDLQHPPTKIIEMYDLWQGGYEIIEGIKSTRGKESKLYKFLAEQFNWIYTKLARIDMNNMSDFKLLDRRVIDTLNIMPEKYVFFRALSSWVGFKRAKIYYDVQERMAGNTKWSHLSLIKYAFNNITSFSSAPLHVVTVLGLLFFIITILLGGVTLVKYWMHQSVEGFTTVILLILITGSVLMFSLGIIGYYLSKIYDEVKRRPRYIVQEILNKEERE